MVPSDLLDINQNNSDSLGNLKEENKTLPVKDSMNIILSNKQLQKKLNNKKKKEGGLLKLNRLNTTHTLTKRKQPVSHMVTQNQMAWLNA